mgnify:FL=1
MANLSYKRSVMVSMLHLLIGMTMGFGLLVLIIQFIGALFGLVDLTVHEWPVTIHAVSAESEASDIVSNGGVIQLVTNDWPFFNLVGTTLYFLNMSVGLAFLYHFRFVIASVENGSPFSMDNHSRLKNMGALLLAGFIISFLNSAIHQWYIVHHVNLSAGAFANQFYHLFMSHDFPKLTSGQVMLDNKHSIAPLFSAVYIYSLAIVFKEGLRLKQDSDSIL